jgi:hypothetical protein|tara:strand:+ start:397 stop:624 length:228 start_codon:yes stop_codon:yes gene_type:complete
MSGKEWVRLSYDSASDWFRYLKEECPGGNKSWSISTSLIYLTVLYSTIGGLMIFGAFIVLSAADLVNSLIAKISN